MERRKKNGITLLPSCWLGGSLSCGSIYWLDNRGSDMPSGSIVSGVLVKMICQAMRVLASTAWVTVLPTNATNLMGLAPLLQWLRRSRVVRILWQYVLLFMCVDMIAVIQFKENYLSQQEAHWLPVTYFPTPDPLPSSFPLPLSTFPYPYPTHLSSSHPGIS